MDWVDGKLHGLLYVDGPALSGHLVEDCEDFMAWTGVVKSGNVIQCEFLGK
jgi:hypothetical protein